MPWKAGFTPSSPGTKTLSVLFSAPKMSSVEISRKIAISMTPSTTPARVDRPTPRYVSHQTARPHATASTTHASSKSMPRYDDRKMAP